MSQPLYFICYSRRDAEDIALRLADRLVAGPPSVPVWIDRRAIQPGIDWDEQVVEALREGAGVLYVLTNDSASPHSDCKREWTRALKYKKPVIPLRFHREAEMPFRLEPRQYIDFTHSYDAGLAQLREHVAWRATPNGVLHSLTERLQDARRDLVVAEPGDAPRIQDEIALIEQQIQALQSTIDAPRAAQQRTQESIARGLERERQPEAPVAPSKIQTRFINRVPLIPPAYFQDRHLETALIGTFLGNDSGRLLTVVGRGGVGKTAMVCRLLRSLEGGRLPDDGGALAVDGILYLSARSGHPVSFPNLFFDLCRLLPEKTASYLEQLYKDPKMTADAQMRALQAAFPTGRTIVLLDNFEDVVDAETQAIKEGDLDAALRAVVDSPPHGLKFVLTTRVAPQALMRVQPGMQERLELDEGLKSPHAENVLKAMDTAGTLGLNAPDAPLAAARKATRGFPRALEAVVGILRADRTTDLRSLLKELQLLGSNAQDVVRDLVGEAYNRLDSLAQEAMQALAVYGAPVPAVAVDYLLEPYRISVDSSRVLARLVNMQFVRGEAGRFHLHQVDRDYALSRIGEGDPGDRRADPPPFTRYALRHRAAEYFRETRKPREAWKTLDDLAPQLAEFDLRLVAEDYEAAANVLLETDEGYLRLWGHYRVLAERYEQLQEKLHAPDLQLEVALGLANAYLRTGPFDAGIRHGQEALALARAQKNLLAEGSALGILASIHAELGQHARAFELYQQALAIYRNLGQQTGEALVRGGIATHLSDIGRWADARKEFEQAIALHKEMANREGECRDTFNLALVHESVGDTAKARALAEDAQRLARAINYRLLECATTSLLANLMVADGRIADAIAMHETACALADDFNIAQFQMAARRELARACLFAGDLRRARALAEAAAKYVWPSSYAGTLALIGIVAARQGEIEAATKAFDLTLREVTPQLTAAARPCQSAYDNAMALAGLTLCRDAALAPAAIAAYHDARAISDAAGVVASALRDLDALTVADSAGTLKPVRAALNQPRSSSAGA